MAFNDNPAKWLTRSRLAVIPIIRAELSTVCELKPSRWQGYTRRPCKGHVCSRWQVYLFWVRGSPTALTAAKCSSPTCQAGARLHQSTAHAEECVEFNLTCQCEAYGTRVTSCEWRFPDLKWCQCFVWSPVIVIFFNREDNRIKRTEVSGPTDRWSLGVPWSCEITDARCDS